jgi:glycosidase
MATFVSSHDIFAGQRLWDQVSGDEARYRLAAAGYLLQPGTPFIYYGEEIGQAGTYCAPRSSQAMPAPQGGARPLGRPCEPLATLEGDLPLRSPMSWSAAPGTAGFTAAKPFRPVAPNHATHNATAQVNDPASLRAFYKAMLALRNDRPSIARGSFEHSFTAGDDGLVLGFQRRLGHERSLVLINYGTRAATIDVPGLLASQRLSALYPAHPSNTTGPALTLAPLSVQVHDIR